MPMRSLTADRLRCLQPRLLCTDPDWRPFGHFRIADMLESGIIAIAFNSPLQRWCLCVFRASLPTRVWRHEVVRAIVHDKLAVVLAAVLGGERPYV
jgi:hypothetical protein